MSSKFSSLLQAKQTQSPIVEESVAKEAPAPTVEEPKQEQEPAVITQPKAEATGLAPVVVPPAESKPPARAPEKTINMQPHRGKKGHPDYNQVTVYLKKETQNKAKIALLQAHDERDFSELMEDLLTNWLAAQT
jgi:hypothetical protein